MGPPPEEDKLTMLSLNTYHIAFAKDLLVTIGPRANRIINWITERQSTYDIILLQEIWEADSRFQRGMTNAGFCHYIYDDRSFLDFDEGYAMGSGLGIYSKHEILDHEFVNF